MNRSFAAATLAVGMIVIGSASAASAADSHDVTVTPHNFNAIFSRGEVDPTSSFAFVIGPANPPLGVGSLQLTTADTSGKQQHLEVQQQGIKISQVDAMSYATFQHLGSTPQVVASINMEIYTNPGSPTMCSAPPTSGETCNRYTTLAFEPYLNGTVTPDMWQAWDAYKGGSALWHPSYTRPIPGSNLTGAPVTWQALVAANPNAVIISYGVNQGTSNANVVSNVDALSIGTQRKSWVYDFEPSASQCANGGYTQFTNPTFKNRGQCEAFFAHEGKGKNSQNNGNEPVENSEGGADNSHGSGA